MLVLSRKKNESICIGRNVQIVVVEIRGDKVRLGIEAPKEIPIHREETFDAIERERPNSVAALAPCRSQNSPLAAEGASDD